MRSTRLVGIVNVTPDSFSDGGDCVTADAALSRIASLIEDGADVIDIGAESTRPGALPLSPEVEWQRLEPVLSQLAGMRKNNVRFSVDTRHAATASAALRYGVDWINDVSGFSNPDMVESVRGSRCMLVVMHSLSIPADPKQHVPEDADVVELLLAYAAQRLEALAAAGIARERLIFDPGIGFGKTAAQSLAILRGTGRLKALNLPLLIGHSRKSFLKAVSDISLPIRGRVREEACAANAVPDSAPPKGEGLVPADRDDATLAVSQFLMAQQVDYIRVHNVARHAELLQVMEALSDG